jgi:hypothetical protein
MCSQRESVSDILSLDAAVYCKTIVHCDSSPHYKTYYTGSTPSVTKYTRNHILLNVLGICVWLPKRTKALRNKAVSAERPCLGSLSLDATPSPKLSCNSIPDISSIFWWKKGEVIHFDTKRARNYITKHNDRLKGEEWITLYTRHVCDLVADVSWATT